MRRFTPFLFLFIIMIACPPIAEGQFIKRAGEMLQTAFEENAADTAALSADERAKLDSIRLHELTLQIQEMKLNEMALRSELDDARGKHHKEDSLKRAEQLHRIDSLRKVTPGVPVVVNEDTLFLLYAAKGGYSPIDRAEMISEAVSKIGNNHRLRKDSIHTLVNDNYIDIMYGDRMIMTVTEQDALWQGTTQEDLAERYGRILSNKIEYMRNENSFWQIIRRGVLFILVLFMQFLMVKLINWLFRKLRRKIVDFRENKLKPVVVRDYELLNTHRLGELLIWLSNILRYLLLLILLVFTVPILFSIFPQTENLALKIFFYIIDPIRMVVKSVVEYVPNLFIIAVIWYCVKYIVKGLRYISEEIERGNLKINGFYPEWAHPTFNIIRFLLYAFMIAMIYPYLPGAESGVFQGISVFVGLIVSLGSSTVISNFIAGFVITYMRPFKTGDFIKVKDTIGTVIEKTPFVTRLRTIKNEVVTIPNSFIMSSDTVNYSASAREYGLIIHTTMTMCYDVPWRLVHELLIKSALQTEGVLSQPRPFVLEMELNDFYMSYQLNAYIKKASDMPDITSALLEHIQDNFKDAGIDLVATHFYDHRADSLPRYHKHEE
ncbi:MAG: mechanosensitive ion channel family protein [Muribaculaceae bacterium]|nr:mechanosensitive ion channel family protein [Muribaculaceae bacterium]